MIKYICNKANECTKDNCDCKNKYEDEPSCIYTTLCLGKPVRSVPVNDPSEKEIKDKLNDILNILDNYFDGHHCLCVIVDMMIEYLKDIGLIVKEEIK